MGLTILGDSVCRHTDDKPGLWHIVIVARAIDDERDDILYTERERAFEQLALALVSMAPALFCMQAQDHMEQQVEFDHQILVDHDVAVLFAQSSRFGRHAHPLGARDFCDVVRQLFRYEFDRFLPPN